VHVDRAAAAEPSRALPRRRGEIAEQPGNSRSKLAELRSKIAVLQEQLAQERLDKLETGAESGGANSEAIEDAIAFIEAAMAGVRTMAQDKTRDSVLRTLERAKEVLS